MLRYQRSEAQFLVPAEARGDHRVENIAGGELATPMEHTQIVVGAMEDEAPPREGFVERLEGKSRERIDQDILVFGADLDETEFFEVAMEAVRLGIQSDSREGGELCDEIRQALGV
jgi:hypothetical protein